MKHVPEIAPEVRGLLEELVADPRSSLRLAPRRALRTWFEGGEVLRPREAGSTALERHLVEAHREALAELFYQAARIAYWKAPRLSHRPKGQDGHAFDVGREQQRWRNHASRRQPEVAEWRDLLRTVLDGPMPGQGLALAQASLALVPSLEARVYLALHSPISALAIELLELTARLRMPSQMRSNVLSCLAAKVVLTGDYRRGWELYRSASEAWPSFAVDRLYSFNLSCFLGDDLLVSTEARELSRILEPSDPRVLETCGILGQWRGTRSSQELDLASKTIAKVMGGLPEVAACLAKVIVS